MQEAQTGKGRGSNVDDTVRTAKRITSAAIYPDATTLMVSRGTMLLRICGEDMKGGQNHKTN